MSIGGKFKGLNNWASDKLQESREYIDERTEIIKDLTMPHLKELEDSYDLTILTLVGDEPTREEYINSIAKTKRVTTEQLKQFVYRVNKKKELELKSPETKQIITHIESNQYMSQSSIGGDINITKNIFKDWSLKIMNSNINFNHRKEALQKIKQLEEEINKLPRNETAIENLYQWFTNHKTVIATLSIPFITKLLNYI